MFDVKLNRWNMVCRRFSSAAWVLFVAFIFPPFLSHTPFLFYLIFFIAITSYSFFLNILLLLRCARTLYSITQLVTFQYIITCSFYSLISIHCLFFLSSIFRFLFFFSLWICMLRTHINVYDHKLPLKAYWIYWYFSSSMSLMKNFLAWFWKI